MENTSSDDSFNFYVDKLAKPKPKSQEGKPARGIKAIRMKQAKQILVSGPLKMALLRNSAFAAASLPKRRKGR